MKILVLNCGSSSIKFQLFEMATNAILTKGIVEKIGLPQSEFSIKKADGGKHASEVHVPDHQIGINIILDALVHPEYGCIHSLSEIDAVGHRLVHGGEKFNQSVHITPEVLEQVRECIDLAPLHNPANIEGVEAVTKLMGDIPQVGVFDTAFHQTMKPEAYLYGLPYELYEKYAIRRYGFHGTSHRYVSKRAAEMVGIPYEKAKIISCHLGNGCSLAAVAEGKSVDTSMGLTPVEGVLMGTRCGDIDAGALLYLMDKEGLDVKAASTLINKKSGLAGVSGVSSDMRELRAAVEAGNERAKLAFDMFVQRIRKYIGAYAAEMGGVDIILFTGGIGENDCTTRTRIAENLEFMGVQIDEAANSVRGEEATISTASSQVKVLVVPTDEELMIALDTQTIVKGY